MSCLDQHAQATCDHHGWCRTREPSKTSQIWQLGIKGFLITVSKDRAQKSVLEGQVTGDVWKCRALLAVSSGEQQQRRAV